ncbi:PAS-domain containing protein [Maritimibacter alkaliphilus]|uniref:PAS-domain containing protein n=1 Tax=Maritimibacter alkaliphilus TaxID=404236 RepID=UPI001C9696FC|nr:PAS-domain containing protein [Maritimibacter alkaliphilus]MBY6090501.1 PAS-domain containing protein [Maritimibacter alkaliphilus]
MSVIGLELVITLVVLSGVIAGAMLWGLARVGPERRHTTLPLLLHEVTETGEPRDPEDVSFLFHENRLFDASDVGREILARADPAEDDWTRLLRMMERRFPGLPERPEDMSPNLRLRLASVAAGDRAVLELERAEGVLRLRITGDRPATAADRHVRLLRQSELSTLRCAALHAPNPIWLTDAAGDILWINDAYAGLCSRREGGPTALRVGAGRIGAGRVQAVRGGAVRRGKTVPAILDTGLPLPPNGQRATARVQIAPGTDTPCWYDVTILSSRLGWMHFATDVTPVVQAEAAQRNFVQTLSKTFAQLSIGLAIFDRDQRLALFNPALLDLTALPADFLSRKPGFRSFFDALRDRQMMPEPKSYANWRARLTELFEAAKDGTYEETWTLPNGLTYRVTGRPHPEGAVAFLIEDISAEIALTRQFRQQLELEQAVLDTMAEAVVVFSPQGLVSFCNTAYRALWNTAPDETPLDVSVLDATRDWQGACDPSPVWGDIRDFVSAYGPRSEWTAQVRLTAGNMLDCRIVPLSGGATLVAFHPQEIASPAPSAALQD